MTTTQPIVVRRIRVWARQRGHLRGQWVTADEDYDKVPSFRDALDAEGWW